jgi:formylglycine-generating enzyme required for sulfatase activity
VSAVTAQDCGCCAQFAEAQILISKNLYDDAVVKLEDAARVPDAREKCAGISALIRSTRQAISARDSNSASVASFLVKISGGTFLMGDYSGEGYPNSRPAHQVTVDDFYLSKYEVSGEEYDAFCDAKHRTKPSFLKTDWGRGKKPAFRVDWYDAIEYCNWLSDQHGLKPVYNIDSTTADVNNKNPHDRKKWTILPDWSANGYRLPTEAEWEYAARATLVSGKVQGGGKVRFANGRDVLQPAEVNFDARPDYLDPYSVAGKFRDAPVNVDELPSNALGLKNMSGNVVEWCWDWYDYKYSSNDEGARNPRGNTTGQYRVQRGGSWRNTANSSRGTNRSYSGPHDYNHDEFYCGFRIARNFTP